MITVLVVTEGGKHAGPFLRSAELLAAVLGGGYVQVDGRGASCLEDVLDEAVDRCPDGHILRLDDDEVASDGMVRWLTTGAYLESDHWAFMRLNLYPDAGHHVTSHGLWPDLQTRLSTKQKSGGRGSIHQGSPYGTGTVAPGDAVIEHHKFLVRPLAERIRLVTKYEEVKTGAGFGFAAFSIPEALDVETKPVPV